MVSQATRISTTNEHGWSDARRQPRERRTNGNCWLSRSGFVFLLLRARQDNAKDRPPIDLGLVLECAAMLFNNARRNREAQPGASLFGGKERVEEALLNFQGDTLAGVNHLQNDCRSGATRLRSEATARQWHQGAART